MTSDDKYKTRLVDMVDNALVEFHMKIAEKWQNKTHRDKADLESILYATSFLGVSLSKTATDTAFNEFLKIVAAGSVAVHSIYGGIRPRKGKDGKIKYFNLDLIDEDFIKYSNITLYGMGIFGTLCGGALLAVGITKGDRHICKEVAPYLSFFLGMFGLASGNYMAIAEVEELQNPKNKSAFGRLRKKIKDYYNSNNKL